MRSLFKSIISTLLVISTQHVAAIHIKGNHLHDDATDKVVVLQGFSHSGTEFACVGGYGIFDGPNDDNSINAMKTWNVNVVRIPLNEDCWLAINGVKQ